MIVKMHKLFCAVQTDRREAMLDALGAAGVLHIEPVDPQVAVADEALHRDLAVVDRAIRALADLPAETGDTPELTPLEAARRIDALATRQAEHEHLLHVLANREQEVGHWGHVALDDLRALDEQGIMVDLFEVPAGSESAIPAECVSVIARPGKGKVIVAVVDRSGGHTELPEDANELERPQWDIPGLRAEAQTIRAAMREDAASLQRLTPLRPALIAERERLQQQELFVCAERSGAVDGGLFAVQGWIPADQVEQPVAALSAANIPAGITTRPPTDEEHPPTLVRYPGWARPIKGLFDILGTVAGYREADVSAAFMLALPLFAAMLIGDAGYGLMLTLLALGLRGKIVAAMGTPTANLAAILGIATMAWGVITNSFFGFEVFFGPGNAPIAVDMQEENRDFLARLSLWIAGVHLTVAWLWRAVVLWPSQRFLAPFGWALSVWGMLGVIFSLLLGDAFGWGTIWPYLLVVGLVLALLFESDSANPLKRLGVGFANMPFELLAKFSDEISYIRLMAVGLASAVLAQTFNTMAGVGPEGTGFTALSPFILVLGHALNFALCLIALFAHGVRLNMLEFSNNLGMEWKGRAYAPFCATRHRSNPS